MQFTADGYTIAGGPLTLTGADALVRIGDGSPADAGITTTISAELAGSARLVKDLGGTLVLTGHQQLHRRHRDQWRHIAHLERRQSGRRGRGAQPQRRHAQHHGGHCLGSDRRSCGRRHVPDRRRHDVHAGRRRVGRGRADQGWRGFARPHQCQHLRRWHDDRRRHAPARRRRDERAASPATSSTTARWRSTARTA